MNNHFPYEKLPDTNWWPRSIRNVNVSSYFTMPSKLGLSPDERISTYGSCFAQRISQGLRSTDNFLDYEQPSEHISVQKIASEGYGIYSARYGNIYSVRQMLELVQRALKIRNSKDLAWERNDGRFVDPFRPNISELGFISKEEVILNREMHLSKVRELLLDSSVIIFTGGLTEIWIDAESGFVVPVCPGKEYGEYSAERYKFKIQKYNEILAELKELYDILKNANPNLKIILTVSPVPLIATMSRHNVFEATCFSKSVLRSVFGDFSDETRDVDYFPSYEIATYPQIGSAWEAENGRTPAADTVSVIMECFYGRYFGNHQSFDTKVFNEQEICDEAIVLGHLANDRNKRQLDLQGRSVLKTIVYGDSHCLPFDGFFEEDKTISNNIFAFESVYRKGFSLCEDNPDILVSKILLDLEHKGLFFKYGSNYVSWQRLNDSNDVTVLKLRRGDFGKPMLLISGLDAAFRTGLKEVLSNQSKPLADGSSAIDSTAIAVFMKKFAEVILPNLKAISEIFHILDVQIVILGLPHSYSTDEQFSQINNYKVTQYHRELIWQDMDGLLKQAASRYGLSYFSYQGATSEGLRNEYRLEDGVHYSRQGARYFGLKIVAENFKIKADKRAWRGLLEKNSEFTVSVSEDVFVKKGFMSKALCAYLNRELRFNMTVGNQHRRRDWEGNDAIPFSDSVKTCRLEGNVLQRIWECLYEGENHEFLTELFSGDYSVVCCRPIMSNPHNNPAVGPQAFHLDYSPCGVVRMIIYLTDATLNTGAFEYIDERNSVVTVEGSVGDAIIFDANRFKHRARPPITDSRRVLDMVVTPSIDGFGRRVTWPGMNHWPVNPNLFSLRGLETYPKGPDVIINR